MDQKPYPERVAAARAATGLRDAAVWGTGRVAGQELAVCVMDFAFMGGSMGSVVGEKVTRLLSTPSTSAGAADGRLRPSGGAACRRAPWPSCSWPRRARHWPSFSEAGVPFSIMTDPTTGGVFASYAALGDVNLAEPNALIGFAGARVAAGTIAEALPPGFQRAEFLFEHGFVDQVVPRAELRDRLALLLGYLRPREAFGEAPLASPPPVGVLAGFNPLGLLGGDREAARG